MSQFDLSAPGRVDFDRARANMVESQIRTWEVLDQRVLEVLARLPREAFVPERYQPLAYIDGEIPLGHGEVMLSPKLEGRILQALNVRPSDRVLEIGTGSGFLTACLAELGGEVISVEVLPELVAFAEKNLDGFHGGNIHLREGDAATGWDNDGDFEAIAVTASMPVFVESYKHQLQVGGRLFAVVGQGPIMEARLITRTGHDDWSEESLFETVLPPLRNAVKPKAFSF